MRAAVGSVIVSSVDTKGPWTTSCPPAGCDEAAMPGLIDALVIFQKCVFTFHGFHQKQSKGRAAVFVFSVVCLLALWDFVKQ